MQVDFMTYEAGPGFVGDGSANDLAIAANRDPRMRQLYIDYARMLRRSGISLLMHFTSVGKFTQYGSWGLLEAMDQDRSTAPKFLALMEYMEETSICPAGQQEDGCSDVDCHGNGVCLLPFGSVENGAACGCYFGATGTACGGVSYIDHYDCGYRCTFDQGTCVMQSIEGVHRYFGCECEPQFYGRTCRLFNCTNDCHWNGECLDYNVCNCYPGFSGSDCAIDCGCGGHGRCSDDARSCICDVGYRWNGTSCEWDCSCPEGVPCIGPGECGCSPSCVYGTCYQGMCDCWAGWSGAACDTAAATPRPWRDSPIGINLAGPTYYSTQWIFVDVMKQSSSWVSRNAPDTSEDEYAWDTGTAQHLRPDGYPSRLDIGQVGSGGHCAKLLGSRLSFCLG